MNFYELNEKLKKIAEAETNVEECGGPMIAHPGQQDNVTMSVNMNGQGAGGIKDLMNILRNIEHGAEHDHSDEPIFTEPSDKGADIILGKEDMIANPDIGAGAGDEGIENEEYGNSAPGGSDSKTFGIDAITQHGDDMHSKGDVKRLKVNGGENPMQEGLVKKLQAHYEQVKLREGISSNHRHHSAAPRVSSMEHHGHGEFTAVIDGEEYHVYAPIDFGSSHDDIPEWVGKLDITDSTGTKLHHADPIFRAVDDELDKLDPADLGAFDMGAAIDAADYSQNLDR